MPADAQTAPNGRILIIDDEEDCFELLQRLVRRVGAAEAIEWCRDGERGLARLRELAAAGELPTLVIVDLKMPAVDGFSVLRCMKADANLSRIFTIVVSSSCLPEDIARALQLGAFCYFEKYPLPEKFARVYEAARNRAPIAPNTEPCEIALRQIIGLVEDALTVFHASHSERLSSDLALVDCLGRVRRRATEKFLERINRAECARWPFEIIGSPRYSGN